MGEGSQNPLNVTILGTTTLHPSEPTEQRCMFLSNIDQVLNFSVETVHFFRATGEYPFERVVETLRSAIEKVLVPYDFMAGRLRLDEEGGRREIECNAAGVRFVLASCGVELDELGELEYPNSAFRELVTVATEVVGGVGIEDQPLCCFQVTSFKCGGFTLGISNDHSTFDGIGFQNFLTNLVALTHGKPLVIEPYNNRRLLAARSPPRVTFTHPELLKLHSPFPQSEGQLLDPPSIMLDATSDIFEFKLFRLYKDNIMALKEKAKKDGCDGLDPRAITSFNVVVAHLWRCKVLATNESHDGSNTSTILFAVDIRKRTSPPLPSSYTGNAVVSAYARATCHELENSPFARIVGKIREGITRITDDYIRSVIDWGQMYKGFPYGDVFVSSWWKLGYTEVEYPWGKPIYSCPVMNPRRDIILLFPSLKGENEGVNVLISLPKGHMEKFGDLFNKFLG